MLLNHFLLVGNANSVTKQKHTSVLYPCGFILVSSILLSITTASIYSKDVGWIVTVLVHSMIILSKLHTTRFIQFFWRPSFGVSDQCYLCFVVVNHV